MLGQSDSVLQLLRPFVFVDIGTTILPKKFPELYKSNKYSLVFVHRIDLRFKGLVFTFAIRFCKSKHTENKIAFQCDIASTLKRSRDKGGIKRKHGDNYNGRMYQLRGLRAGVPEPVSYTHLRAHETDSY